MVIDPTLLGHETQPVTATITAEDVRQFADAIFDKNPMYRDAEAARALGFANIPAPPTFVTRFIAPFEEVGLDVRRMQVLHAEQEYTYTRPLLVGEIVSVRHRVANIRQRPRGDGMAILTLEQLVDGADGERIVTGTALVIARNAPPQEAAASVASAGAKAHRLEPTGEEITRLSRFVTQEQINAYADASGDHNPIHLDPEQARAVGLDGTIAHGMLDMAFVGQLLTDWLVTSPNRGGWVRRLRVRFQAMVRPGDTITCYGVLEQRTENVQALGVWMDNERGEQVIVGSGEVVLV